MNAAIESLQSAVMQHGGFINSHTARLAQHDQLIALLIGVNVALAFWLIVLTARGKNKQ